MNLIIGLILKQYVFNNQTIRVLLDISLSIVDAYGDSRYS